jgi:SAM-dependent methyltransferase
MCIVRGVPASGRIRSHGFLARKPRMADATTPPHPTTIQHLATAVYPSFAMLAGMQLDVFTPLKDGARTAAQLADTLSVKEEKLSRLLYALVAANLLTVEGDRFANTPEAQQFLVKGQPTYLGGRHENFSEVWEALLHTAETIRTGVPQCKKDFATLSPDAQLPFFRGLHPRTMATGRDLASRYNFSASQTLADVGGDSGGMALALTDAYPHLQATVIDLPTVTPITQRFIAEAGAADRVQVVAADVVHAPVPGRYDVAVARAFLQVLAPDDALQALRHIGAALHPGGRLYIVGSILDAGRLSPLGAMGFNLVALKTFDEGRAYTEGEYRAWLTAAGFGEMARVPLAEGVSIMTARKPV